MYVKRTFEKVVIEDTISPLKVYVQFYWLQISFGQLLELMLKGPRTAIYVPSHQYC